jgi:hypothetical protein
LRFVPSAENLPFSQPFAQRLLAHDEARRIAANITKLPQGAAAKATGLHRPHFRYDLNSGHFAGLRSLKSWATGRVTHRSEQPR